MTPWILNPSTSGESTVPRSPFFNPVEGTHFSRFSRQSINTPRYLDWDLLQSVGEKAQLLRYLKTFEMVRYAQMEPVSDILLCQEFLCTLDLAGDLSSFTCRLCDKPFQVTMSTMATVFGFPARNMGVRCIPTEFNPVVAWHELTGFNNWQSGGISNGFIRDPIVGILHKFLAYNILGNEEGNNVNLVELYLLDCAVKVRKVCATLFLLAFLHNILNSSRCKPAFPHIAGALAAHFEISPPNGF